MQYKFSTLRDEYRELWEDMRVLKVSEANAQARRIIAPMAKSRYKAVEARTGVPWFVIGCMHMRESNADFNTWLHNGDPMRRKGRPARTVNVPANRPPDPNVSWEDGAYDALVTIEHFDEIKDWGPEHVAYANEKFNGFGYRSPARNIPSPYLWGGTSVQKKGKFVSDGKYSSSVMDPQIGAMAVLKQIMVLEPDAQFRIALPVAVAEEPLPTPPTLSPKAEDTETEIKPLTKSKTMWGGVLQYLTGVGATFAGLFQYLATPWGFALAVLIIAALSLGAYLVIKGRLDVQALVKHLSHDDNEEVA